MKVKISQSEVKFRKPTKGNSFTCIYVYDVAPNPLKLILY